MTSNRVWTATAIGSILLLAGMVIGQAAPKGKPSSVAVVDIQTVFNTCKQKQQLDGDINSKTEQVKAQDADKQKAIRQLQADLEILQPGTTAHTQKLEELERASIDRNVWLQYEQNKLTRESAMRIERLYQKIREICGELAKENGYDLVLFQEPTGFTYENVQQLMANIGNRKVIWAAQGLDVTELAVQKLNNAFTAGQ